MTPTSLSPGLPVSLRMSLSLSGGEQPRGLSDDDTLFVLLDGVRQFGSLARAARAIGMSYRHAWGLLRDKEAQLRAELIHRTRGRGATLSETGARLIWAHKRVASHFAAIAANLESEFRGDLAGERSGTLRVRGSLDDALDLLRDAVESLPAATPLDLRFGAWADNLRALAQGECDVASFACTRSQHRGTVQHLASRRWLDRRSQRLVRVGVRGQVLMLRPGLEGRIDGLADLAAGGWRYVQREQGSYARMLADQLLRDAGVAMQTTSGSEEATDVGLAARIAAGQADCGIGRAGAARQVGLAFLPLAVEDCYLLVRKEALDSAGLAALVAALRDARFRRQLAYAEGYEMSAAGEVLTLEAALPWM